MDDKLLSKKFCLIFSSSTESYRGFCSRKERETYLCIMSSSCSEEEAILTCGDEGEDE